MNKKHSDLQKRCGREPGGQRERDRSRSRSPIGHRRNQSKEYKEGENVASSNNKNTKSVGGIQMKLNLQKESATSKPKLSIASAFNQDSDDEPEEMPPEAKMRMRNIGRDTPTSSGPNSFGKTKHGFSDAKKVFEKNLKKAMDSALKDD